MSAAPQAADGLPLAGIRVVDAVAGPLAPLTRYLAELGAEVNRIVDDAAGSDGFDQLAANAGKQRPACRPGSEEAAVLIGRAHAIVEDVGLDCAALRRARSSLVTMTVSDFGHTTGFEHWQATDAVLLALSGELCRSGVRGRAPLLPPHGIGYQCAASQGAFLLVAALYRSLRTGRGDHLDFSALEGAMQALDPGYGIGGSATLGRPASLLSPDRPPAGLQYPIIPCADGHVRLCLLAARQWQGMFRWMGEPRAFADPAFNKTAVRYKSPDLLPAIAAFFAGQTRAELERGGQAHGVPVAALATLAEAIEATHFAQRETFRPAGNAPPGTILPAGVIGVDGARCTGGGHAAWADAAHLPAGAGSGGPFAGLRVLDLGVIVVGAETARLLGDGGADVVKVESRAFPDGNRQSYLPYDLSVSFAAGHRNKRSLGLDLRDPRGRDTFLALAARADVVLSNFKPGTMEALGLGHDALLAANPRIVVVESSAFGASGPWSRRMGYGPLVRAATGLTERWRYAADPDGYADSVTIYPDHAAARIGALAATALLIRRLRTGRGGWGEVAQADVMLSHFAADIARISAQATGGGPPDRPWGVYAGAGSDAWCVVSVRGDKDWRALAPILGLEDDPRFADPAGRARHVGELDATLGSWMKDRDVSGAAELLQRAGVPAAPMLRVAELPGFAFYGARGFFREENHPHLAEVVTSERYLVRSAEGEEIDQRPAPLAGEHSEEVLGEWLGLTPGTIADLVADGVVQPTLPEVYDLIRTTMANGGAAEPAVDARRAEKA